MSGVLIAVPHASVRLPDELRARVLPHVDSRFLLLQSDMFTDAIYSVPGAENVIYEWSRFAADPNRYEGQKTEGGIVPVIDFEHRPLYREGCFPDTAECEALVERYHRPYHAAVKARLDEGDFCFFIDGHSMMETAPKRSPDFGRKRPDVCLSNCGDEEGEAIPGGRRLVCSPEKTREIQDRLRHWLLTIPAPDCGDKGAVEGTVLLNKPFLGGHGVRTHARPDAGIPGLQLELNQRLWIDETTWEPLPGRVEWIRQVLERFVAELAAAR